MRILCEKRIKDLEQRLSPSQNLQLHKEHDYFSSKLRHWYHKEIDGYQTRIKTQPRLEPGEPNISFFADLEKRVQKRNALRT